MSNQRVVAAGGAAEVGAGCEPAVLREQPVTEAQAAELARVFKALGDPVRVRLLSLIASHDGGEVCVCELSGAFDLTGPTISHHLKVLREAGLVTGERRGTWVYYRAIPEALAALAEALRPATVAGAGA
ncbi:ArsR family transcriptional regulator [Streptoalloteichus tenebrarius]|uniref:ArsR family transcriptional regulator n=1 Tax=Streptoalloteichus tenebrarius (strain ATCC 17920 / DSM 40477 / JCM 4838 / CBS 697.72 / NBRC 16177 / NCIMB 11028 / NRRL B-12390 / A12253. 1 / ISP 5477) TaxID=1933 RepID=A0ABT1HP02_STRSD|nr:metalloregulator ArsR/SmtB family transcription factor [Streptoalloteichus tenebrarius]MCP2257210.1 ArsR family transcriptional regulator [Streptoalloteichus tenebrarius]BFE98845.1 metalloregulator ArsR/SmtB family transcription factor [Streptoalloteichus tenebrarius]